MDLVFAVIFRFLMRNVLEGPRGICCHLEIEQCVPGMSGCYLPVVGHDDMCARS